MSLVFSVVANWRLRAPSSPAPAPNLVLPSAEVQSMDTAAMWDLAKESADRIAVIAATLSAKESQDISRNLWKLPLIKRLGELAGYLLRVSFVQDKDNGDQHTGPERARQFLGGLEQLCTFMCPPQALDDLNLGQSDHCPFPILNALQSLTPGDDSALVGVIDNSLKAFVSADLRPRTRGQNHARQPNNYVKKYFAYLESFSTTRDQSENEAQAAQTTIAERSAKDIETPSDIPAHVHKTLYNILAKKYSQCCCAPSRTQPTAIRQHKGRLRLKESVQIAEDNVVFNTVFSRHPRLGTAHPVEWQHLEFQIPRKKSGVAQVGFTDNAPSQCSKPPNATLQARPSMVIKSAGQFCELLQKRLGPAKICLHAKGNQIYQLPDLAEVDDDIANDESISLSDVLQRHELVTKKRLLLAYVLAQSFWQYYNSEWMSVRWTPGIVHFFYERRVDDDDDDTGILDESPYISLPSAGSAPSLLSAEHLPTESVVHRYPRLLAFGMMLLEIGRRRQRCAGRQNGRNEQEQETIEERISTDLNDIRSALRRKSWPRLDVQDEVRQTLRAVLSNCSNPRLFEDEQASAGSTGSEEFTIEERRAIIYRRIVYPLKTLMEKLGWVDLLGNIKRQDDTDDSFPDDHDIEVTQDAASFLNTGPTSATAQTSQQKAEQWLLRIQTSDVTKILFAGFQANRSIKRIRIAVLDTGYDPLTTFFSDRSRKRRIQRWKDMADEDSPSGQDEDGHGTHVLSLLMKVIPAADFYVVRIARKRDDLVNSTSNVAKAIKWAAEEQQADIISMSFGFDHEIAVGGKMVISNAISDALRVRDQQILFFAAAANEGGNQPEMFPANHPHVISIRGTDDKGWLQRFNPAKGYTGLNCFMTLGQDVPGAGLSRDGGSEVHKSGTSVSTPIAAGIAAIVLSYARLYSDDLKEFLGENDRSRRHTLSTVSGMRNMFRRMSTEMMDGWYYLAADQFLKLPTHQARLGWIAL